MLRRPSRTTLLLLIALALIASLLVALAPGLRARRLAARAGTSLPDTLGIELAGVVPTGSDELYDPSGKPIGRYEVTMGWFQEHLTKWDSPNTIRRDFVFRIPPSREPVLCLPPRVQCSESGEEYPFDLDDPFALSHARCAGWQAGTTVSLPLLFHTNRFDRPSLTSHVDITFRYVMGRPDPADYTMKGPFKIGGTYTDPRYPQYTLAITTGGITQFGSGPPRIMNVNLVVKADKVKESRVQIVVYDKAGRCRMPVFTGGGSSGARQGNRIAAFLRMLGIRSYASSRPDYFNSTGQFTVQDIRLEDIAAVAINGRLHERTFRGVAFSPQPGGETDHMAYLDELAGRLGLPPVPDVIKNRGFGQERVFMATVDLLREDHFIGAVSTFTTLASQSMTPKPGDFTPEELRRVRAAVDRALRSPDEVTRRAGVLLGMWLDWPEYLEQALQAMQRPFPMTIRHGAFMEAVLITNMAFNVAVSKRLPEMNEAQIRQVVRHLTLSSDARMRGQLIRELKTLRAQPLIQRALIELAECDRPWVWMEVLARPEDVCALATPAHAPLPVPDTLSRKIRLRAVALGFEQEIPQASQLAAEAHAMLPGLMTLEFVENTYGETQLPARLIGQIEQHTPPAEATRIYVALLRRMLAGEGEMAQAEQYLDSLDTAYQFIAELMAHSLNHLNGPGDAYDDAYRPVNSSLAWPDLARQAIAWHDGRQAESAGVTPSASAPSRRGH